MTFSVFSMPLPYSCVSSVSFILYNTFLYYVLLHIHNTGYNVDITSFVLMLVMHIRAYSQRFSQGLSVINICVLLSRAVLTVIDRNATRPERRFVSFPSIMIL